MYTFEIFSQTTFHRHLVILASIGTELAWGSDSAPLSVRVILDPLSLLVILDPISGRGLTATQFSFPQKLAYGVLLCPEIYSGIVRTMTWTISEIRVQARVLLLDYSAVLSLAAFISKSTQYNAAQSIPTRFQRISNDIPGCSIP